MIDLKYIILKNEKCKLRKPSLPGFYNYQQGQVPVSHHYLLSMPLFPVVVSQENKFRSLKINLVEVENTQYVPRLESFVCLKGPMEEPLSYVFRFPSRFVEGILVSKSTVKIDAYKKNLCQF